MTIPCFYHAITSNWKNWDYKSEHVFFFFFFVRGGGMGVGVAGTCTPRNLCACNYDEWAESS